MAIFGIRTGKGHTALAVALCLFCAASATDYSVISVAETHPGNFERSATTIQVGDNPVNRFTMHRWLRAGIKKKHVRGNIILLAGLSGSFKTFELDEDGSMLGSTAAFFARRNFAVYGYSPRVTDLPAGACESAAVDCSVMSEWDLPSMIEDISYIRGRIEEDYPGKKTVVGGLSLGAINTIALLNAHPDDYDGGIIWEGMLYSEDAEVLAMNVGYCAGVQDMLDNGLYYEAQGLGLFKAAAGLSQADPDGASPFAGMLGLPAGTTNHQFLVFVLSEEIPGPATLPVPGHINMAGDWMADKLTYADDERVYKDVTNFNNYAPNAVVRDISCSLAGLLDQFTDNLGAFQGEILAIRAGRGFGPYMQDNLDLFTAAHVTSHQVDPFGHVDHFFLPSPIHRLFVEGPIHLWLTTRVLH